MRLYLQCLLILKCLGIVISFCVLDKKKGWWLDCGIRDSYLLRLKDFGGLQANFNIGIGLGDEKGFPNSITKTSYNSKGSHNPPLPPPEFIPAHYSGHRRNDVQPNPNRRSEFPYQFEVPSTHSKPPPPLPRHGGVTPVRLSPSRENGQTWSQISQKTSERARENKQKTYPYQATYQNQRHTVDQQLPHTRSQIGSNRLQVEKESQWPNPGKASANQYDYSSQRIVPPLKSQNEDWQPLQRMQSQYSQKQEKTPQKLQSGHWSQVLSGQQGNNQKTVYGQRLQNSQNLPQANLKTRWQNSNQQEPTPYGAVSNQILQVENPSNQAQRRFQQIGPEENNFRPYSPSSRLIPPPPIPPQYPINRAYPPPPPSFVPGQNRDYDDYDYDTNRREFQVFRFPKVTTLPTPTIGPDMAELLKLPAETFASSDDVPSFAAKKFVVREAPVEFYPPFYNSDNTRNRPKIHVEIPRTNFYCEEQKFSPGIYADAKLGCKMFHLCVPSSIGSTLTSYLCPNGTLFDQSILQCNYWYTVDCEASINDYDANLALALSYRRINAAHLPLAGATNVNTLSLLSQNVNQYQDSSKNEIKISRRMGKVFSDEETYDESSGNENVTDTTSNSNLNGTISNLSIWSHSNVTVDKDINLMPFVPSNSDDSDSWIPILRNDDISKTSLKYEAKRQNKANNNEKSLSSPLSNSIEPETDIELMELIVEIQDEFKLKKLNKNETRTISDN